MWYLSQADERFSEAPPPHAGTEVLMGASATAHPGMQVFNIPVPPCTSHITTGVLRSCWDTISGRDVTILPLLPPRWVSVDGEPCIKADEHKALRWGSAASHRTVRADLTAGAMGDRDPGTASD